MSWLATLEWNDWLVLANLLLTVAVLILAVLLAHERKEMSARSDALAAAVTELTAAVNAALPLLTDAGGNAAAMDKATSDITAQTEALKSATAGPTT